MSDPFTPTPRSGRGIGPAGASLSDLLTAVQHVASNIANLAQIYLAVQGALSAPALSGAPTLLKTGSGRIATVSVTVAGSAPVQIIDANNAAATSPVIAIVPAAVGVNVVNLPFSLGLVVIPGAGVTCTVSFS